MVLQVEQLVYTSFPEAGFQVFAGQQVPDLVQQSFVEDIVNRHWNAYSPPSTGYRAAYLHQLSEQESLFGWLYSVGIDDLGRIGVPYFLCYYLVQDLDSQHLNLIFDYLGRGPQTWIECATPPLPPPPLTLLDVEQYEPVKPGVFIPSATRARCRLMMDKQRRLNCWVPFEPETDAAVPPTVLDEPKGVVLPFRAAAAKVALLIGVGEYGAGLSPLPGAIADVETLREGLAHPALGGFTEVKTLFNPDPQTMSEAIEALFLDRQPEDLVLLYFSGYVTVDTDGKIGLATALSRRGTNGYTIRSTVVTADFINDVMRDSRSQRQTLVLDWSLAEGEPMAQALETVAFAPQLRGDHRTLLMSMVSTQAADVPPAQTGSAYTFFLVEGLQTGAADRNGDGEISLAEWHHYARRRLQQVSPAAHPRLYGSQAAHIPLAQSAVQTPQFKYRRQVEICNRGGQLVPAHRVFLNTLYRQLGLSLNEAALIEASVFQPFRDHQAKLQEYAIAFTQAIQEGYPLPADRVLFFQDFQAQLGLTDADVVPIESELVRHLHLLTNPDAIVPPLPIAAVTDQRQPLTARVKQRLGYAWAQGCRTVQPYLKQSAIAPRHCLSRWQQALARWTVIRLPARLELRRWRSLNMIWLFLGLGLGTAVVWIVVNHRQIANRRPRTTSESPTQLLPGQPRDRNPSAFSDTLAEN